MPKKYFSIGGVVAGVFFAIICGVILTALISLYKITGKLSGTPAIIFASLNLLILFFMVFLGKILSIRVSFASSVQIWFVTIIYTLIQFVVLFLLADVWGNVGYTLFQLVVFAIWFGIAGAAMAVGKHNHEKENNVI